MAHDTSDTTTHTLRCEGVSVAFAGVAALEDVTLSVSSGEVLGLIGPNGAGKTTMINVLSGFVAPHAGRVLLDERDVTGHSPQALARVGVGRTFQAVRLFGRMTALENLEVASVAVGRSMRAARAKAEELLERLGLTRHASTLAGALPYGDERRLALARTLATEPALLLLDEPAAGLNEQETSELTATIAGLPAAFGCGVLVVEHDMRLIMSLCERIHVLAHGKTLCTGTTEQVRADPDVIAAYLGTERTRA